MGFDDGMASTNKLLQMFSSKNKKDHHHVLPFVLLRDLQSYVRNRWCDIVYAIVVFANSSDRKKVSMCQYHDA